MSKKLKSKKVANKLEAKIKTIKNSEFKKRMRKRKQKKLLTWSELKYWVKEFLIETLIRSCIRKSPQMTEAYGKEIWCKVNLFIRLVNMDRAKIAKEFRKFHRKWKLSFQFLAKPQRTQVFSSLSTVLIKPDPSSTS